MPGIFTISLDFELYWGVRDKLSLGEYGANVLGAHQAVPELLRLFGEQGVHATWATVGFLFFENKESLLQALPGPKPGYANPKLSPYSVLPSLLEGDPHFFAPGLVEQILVAPGQELASHTFCHYYALEAGQTAGQFQADLQAAQAVSQKRFGKPLKSLVFPRNQANHLQVVCETGFTAYRGNEQGWFYGAYTEEQQTPLRRALRLADNYLNLSGHHTYPRPGIQDGLVNIPSSRFLRPYSPRLAPLEPLRLARIVRSMEHAARANEVYHLWWHPENFGVNIQQNLDFLRRVLEHFKSLQAQQGMQSLNMGEIAALAQE
ncbi:MAG: polysaccharide deacetylase family protein [Thermaceae bacterium]|nr:polysaccharide deacetylase family protein [Thermaceae bacterium]